MSYSLNEIEALVRRAVRGSGADWGTAEATARGVRWLSGHALPGCEALAALLDIGTVQDIWGQSPVLAQDSWAAAQGALNPLLAGLAMSDRASAVTKRGELRMQAVYCPLLLLPFVVMTAMQSGSTLVLQWSGVTVVSDGSALWQQGERQSLLWQQVDKLNCRAAAVPQTPPRMRTGRAQPEADALATLSRFAHKTYAPATEESRLRGAGAGLDDND